jgi:outer membrane lipoprotein-sorting protein
MIWQAACSGCLAMHLSYNSFGTRSVPLAVLATALLPIASTLAAPMNAAIPATVEQIVASLENSEHRKQNDLQSYSSVRRYVLKNQRFKQDAEMMVRMDFTSEKGKHFEILSENGTEGFSRRLLKKVLDGEAETSRTQAKELSKVTSRNYSFRLLGIEYQAGQKCYVLEIKPKMKSKYLLDGKVWVDSGDFQLVRMEGRTTASLSFWVGKPYIVYDFQKVGDFWLAARNQALADARFIGAIQLTIEVQGYELQPGHQERVALEKLPQLRSMDTINE